MINYIEKLKDLKDKCTPGHWSAYIAFTDEGYSTLFPDAINECKVEDLRLINHMRNSLDLWLELAESVEAFHEPWCQEIVCNLALDDRFIKMRDVLQKLKGEIK